MALIQCPECGRSVSDQAGACPDCGYPLANKRNADVIRIKTPSPNGSALGQFKIIDMDTSIELARVAQGSVATIKSTKPLNLGISWGLGGKPSKGCCFQVYPGKKYSVLWTQGWFVPGLVCNEVDVFDSE